MLIVFARQISNHCESSAPGPLLSEYRPNELNHPESSSRHKQTPWGFCHITWASRSMVMSLTSNFAGIGLSGGSVGWAVPANPFCLNLLSLNSAEAYRHRVML